MYNEIITLDHGSGGKVAHRFIQNLFFKHFSNSILEQMDDAALLNLSGKFAMSTDSYTISPIEFKGGNIGSLAVHGTVNDVAMLGAKALYLSAAFIIEEGFSMKVLERIVKSMGEAARAAGVKIVTGDTKVVPKGAADGIFINTTGIGSLLTDNPPQGHKAQAGDAVLLSGSLGDHGITVLASRAKLELAPDLTSDSAALNHIIEELIRQNLKINVLRDPTRGGLATTLNEIALQSQLVCELQEELLPIKDSVAAACSILGLDPLYLANEGKFICILAEEHAEKALQIIKSFPEGKDAVKIGKILALTPLTKRGQVILQTPLGGKRLLSMLEGEQLPRIC